MATITLVNDLMEDLGNGVHNLSSNTLLVTLSNTAPGSESSDPTADGNGVIANVTAISYTSYTDDLTVDRTLEGVAWVLATGTATLDANDFTITASGGTLATWRYLYVWNTTPTSPADPIIAVYDHGSTVSLADGESIDIDFGADAGTDGNILTLASA